MLLMPAPLSDELTKLATLPSELRTDSKLDIAENSSVKHDFVLVQVPSFIPDLRQVSGTEFRTR
jgi:hypothetical protein